MRPRTSLALTVCAIILTVTPMVHGQLLREYDGGDWREWGPAQKVDVVSGYVMAMMFAANFLPGLPRDDQPFYVGQFHGKTMEQIAQEVDEWYLQTRRWDVPIYVAIFARGFEPEGSSNGKDESEGPVPEFDTASEVQTVGT